MVPIVGALFVAGRFAPQGQFRSASYDFMQAMIVNGAYTSLLKYTVKRERPDGSDSLSFPSGHTSTAFSLAAVASSHYGWKIGVPAYALATGIGLSRIEQDRHHLSDVIAGATLGVIVGRTVSRLDGDGTGAQAHPEPDPRDRPARPGRRPRLRRQLVGEPGAGAGYSSGGSLRSCGACVTCGCRSRIRTQAFQRRSASSLPGGPQRLGLLVAAPSPRAASRRRSRPTPGRRCAQLRLARAARR